MGIDGCKGGWCGVWFTAERSLRLSLRATLEELLFQDWPSRGLVLLDMPVGLPQPENPRRECDILARRLLGKRGASVFSPPCREALEATGHEQACRVNRALLGCGLSIQAFNIGPKIRECDQLMRSKPLLRPLVLEAHPELAYAALNGGAPLGYNKRTRKGREQRLELLRTVLPEAPQVLERALREHPRRLAAEDDFLDALVLAWAASLGREGLASLPPEDVFDAMGLPMRIVYPAAKR